MENEINYLSQTTSDAPKEASQKDSKHRHNNTRKNRRSKKKRPYRVWGDDEDDLLKKVYPHLSPSELQKLFPDRTPDAVDMRASFLGVKKTEKYISAQNSSNSSKLGLTNFADHPIEALALKHPDLKQAYDEMVEKLLMHPAVDPNNVLHVEMIKEAILSKIMQYLMMRDRLENNCKGKTLIINNRTGEERWVEARYPHGPDIMNDAKLSRTILRDLGIIREEKQKVEVLGKLRMLWERDYEENKALD